MKLQHLFSLQQFSVSPSSMLGGRNYISRLTHSHTPSKDLRQKSPFSREPLVRATVLSSFFVVRNASVGEAPSGHTHNRTE